MNTSSPREVFSTSEHMMAEERGELFAKFCETRYKALNTYAVSLAYKYKLHASAQDFVHTALLEVKHRIASQPVFHDIELAVKERIQWRYKDEIRRLSRLHGQSGGPASVPGDAVSEPSCNKPPPTVEEIPCNRPSPREIATSRDTRHYLIVEKAKEFLRNEKHRQVIAAVYPEDGDKPTLAEVANTTGESLNNVKAISSRFRNLLKDDSAPDTKAFHKSR